jgi:hypothetical protein
MKLLYRRNWRRNHAAASHKIIVSIILNRRTFNLKISPHRPSDPSGGEGYNPRLARKPTGSFQMKPDDFGCFLSSVGAN